MATARTCVYGPALQDVNRPADEIRISNTNVVNTSHRDEYLCSTLSLGLSGVYRSRQSTRYCVHTFTLASECYEDNRFTY